MTTNVRWDSQLYNTSIQIPSKIMGKIEEEKLKKRCLKYRNCQGQMSFLIENNGTYSSVYLNLEEF
jgi:hypothetical protein